MATRARRPKTEARPTGEPTIEGKQHLVPATAEGTPWDQGVQTPGAREPIEPAPPPQSLADSIGEVLAQEGRMNKMTLCERLGVGIPAFNACIVDMVEAGKLKTQEVEDTTEVYLPLTEQEAKDYERLLKTAKGHDQFLAAKEIHDRKLHRQSYRSWDEWLHYELGREHDWWTTECRRFDTLKLMKERGIKWKIPPNKAILLELAQVRGKPEVFVAVVAEFQGLPETRQIAKELRAIVSRHLAHGSKLDSLRRSVPDVTGEEVALLKPLGDGRWAWKDEWSARAQEESQQTGQPVGECLLEVCREVKQVPGDVTLLGFARGQDLAPLVHALLRLQTDLQREREKEDKKRRVLAEAERLGLKLHDPNAGEPTGGAATQADPEQRSDPPAEEEEQAGVGAGEGGDAPHERSEPDTDSYHVQLTGDFRRWHQAEGYDALARDDLAELLHGLAEAIENGAELLSESSITIRPAPAAELTA